MDCVDVCFCVGRMDEEVIEKDYESAFQDMVENFGYKASPSVGSRC